MSEQIAQTPSATPAKRWQVLNSLERRVLGVLAEKAKTTPDIYPMSLNAICTGCNQKSNRAPLMEVQPEDVEEALTRLRELGAVGLVEGYGRVQKYRHYLYDWLGVDKAELAVMTELLLRGDQTVGELRGRAARMEPIADLAALRPVVDALKSKGLILSLTPEGRGHVVTHALYKPRELEGLQAKYHGYVPNDGPVEHEPATVDRPRATAISTPATPAMPTPAATSGISANALESLRQEFIGLRQQVSELQREVEELRDLQARSAEQLQSLRDSLGG